ncbi:hypothetical protein N8289_03165 [Flavobacteriales bacterium]|nr:hypothetical protein [Flavobacteriales bacterium]
MTTRITLFADVILPLPIPNLFTYRVPLELNDSVQVGNNSYKINLKLYRNCSGIPMGLFQIVNYNSVSCGGGGNLLMIPDTSYEVSQVCDSLLSQTTCNGGTLPGIEVYIFSATVTLPSES